MIYFDSDVLVNYFVEQDLQKNQKAIELYKENTDKKLFFCSVISLQETAFVLSRLKTDPDEIRAMVQSILSSATANCKIVHFKRAMHLARKIGFRHINDCLHTAIAEEYCEELYTFNKADFKRIQKYTSLKITIL